jgi:Radical SAM superfamily/B12 binding domain
MANKKILIIQPSHYVSKADRTIYKSKTRALVPLVLPYLASLTPPDWDVTLIDEQVQDFSYDTKPDLVAITTWTVHSLRAYDIAGEFRSRGIPVIMGGPHIWFHPEEAAQHCDAIGIGEGEPIWSQMLQDAAGGRLQPVYRASQMPSIADLPLPRWDLLDLKKYGMFKTFSLMSSRGCPMQCEFCSERLYLGGGFRVRPDEDVIEDIKHTGSKYVFFGDSDFGGKRAHAMKLMEAMIPLKVHWSALWTSFLCYDDEYMDLAERSGLLHVNMGIESIDRETLKGMNKKFNKVEKYSEMLANLRRRGIRKKARRHDGRFPGNYGAHQRHWIFLPVPRLQAVLCRGRDLACGPGHRNLRALFASHGRRLAPHLRNHCHDRAVSKLFRSCRAGLHEGACSERARPDGLRASIPDRANNCDADFHRVDRARG